MKSYPFLRVFIGFSLCPILVVPLFSVWVFVAQIVDINNKAMSFFLIFGTSVSFGAVAGVAAVTLYGIPAVLLSGVYVAFRPFRHWYSVLLITATGALGAYVWNLFFALKIVPMAAAVLGAVSSFVMAFFVLPRNSVEKGL